MMKNKAIFIIPGYRQNSKSKTYQKITKLLKKEDFSPILVDIPWKDTTISENTDYFLKIYKKLKAEKKYILGFSYGAMIAFIASSKVATDGLLLCSLSPYFNEDIKSIKEKNMSSLMEKRYKDFLTLHSATISKKLKAKKVVMLYGKEESKILIKRVTKAFNEIKTSKKYLVPVSRAEHELGDKNYLLSIQNSAKNIL